MNTRHRLLSNPCLASPQVALFVSLFVLWATPAHSRADDWPQWLGPQRDSVWRESGILDTFPPEGPQQVWRQKIGFGFAGPAVAQGRVFVVDYLADAIPYPSAGRRDTLKGVERVLCLDAGTGKILWKHEDECTYHLSYPYGPRVTPTVDENRVYTLGAAGRLLCLSVHDGAVIWSKQLTDQYHCETPQWGFAGHPLIDGNRLICLVGGEGSVAVALNKETGEEIWRALSAKEPGYCPPTLIQAGGTRQLLIWHPESLNSLNPETGELYWSEKLEPSWGMSIATPRKAGSFLFVGGVVMKSMLLKLAAERPAAEFVWQGKKGTGLGPVFSTPFIEDGHLYGVDMRGELRCVKLDTGKQIWSTYAATTGDRQKNNASAFLVKQRDRFFIFNDRGELIIARLSPQQDPIGYEELSRTKILEPLSKSEGRDVLWSHPAFAQKCIFARNDKEIVCISLKKG